VNNLWGVTNNTSRSISGLGKVDITNDLDTVKTTTGYKPIITGGGVEWSYCVPNASFMGGKTWLLIDMRQFGNVNPTTVTSVKILDAYDGPVTYLSHDPNGWAQYTIDNPLTKVTDGTSSFNQYIRNVRGENAEYAFACSISFSPTLAFKQHGIDVIANSQIELNTLYNSIVGVSDVYLAFKELANGGLFGNESGNEFTSGIQYMNADVDGNGVFNEADAYRLLQHLTGVKLLTDYSTLTYYMKLYSKSDYDSITKSNWNTKFNSTRSLFPFSLNTGTLNNTYNVNVTWIGDVNLSHSAQQTVNGVASNSIRTMSLNTNAISNEINASVISELIGGKVVITISLDPLQQEVSGTQFQLNYDNTSLKFEKVEYITKGNPMNYGADKGTYINLGSLITDGSTTLDKTTEYKITFIPLIGTFDTLGLTSISTTDAVNKNGTQLKMKLN
jgi:hypothetical protein